MKWKPNDSLKVNPSTLIAAEKTALSEYIKVSIYMYDWQF